MKRAIVIAEPREMLRLGIRTLFQQESGVSTIYDASTLQELMKPLQSSEAKLVFIAQTLVTDFTLLPRGNFAILTAEPDVEFAHSAQQYGACAYLSDGVSSEVLRMVLYLNEGAFLLDPDLTPALMAQQAKTTMECDSPSLTPREREIVSLLAQGHSRQKIAQLLFITESTLKTHIKHISHKRQLVGSETR
jgi:DNA-binding NarL/FixJ family response regulator